MEAVREEGYMVTRVQPPHTKDYFFWLISKRLLEEGESRNTKTTQIMVFREPPRP